MIKIRWKSSTAMNFQTINLLMLQKNCRSTRSPTQFLAEKKKKKSFTIIWWKAFKTKDPVHPCISPVSLGSERQSFFNQISFLEVVYNLEKMYDFQFIKINGMNLKYPEQVYSIILEEISGITDINRQNSGMVLSNVLKRRNFQERQASSEIRGL